MTFALFTDILDSIAGQSLWKTFCLFLTSVVTADKGLGLRYNTDEFGKFRLQGLNFTFVRKESEVGMGDQWELDAEDQMGDTLCICGKVFANSNIAPLLYFGQLEVLAVTMEFSNNLFRCMRMDIS